MVSMRGVASGLLLVFVIACSLLFQSANPAMAQGDQATPVSPELSAAAITMSSITAHTTTPIVHPGGGAKYTAELIANGNQGDKVYVTSIFNSDLVVDEYTVAGTTYGNGLRSTDYLGADKVTFHVQVGADGNANFRYQVPAMVGTLVAPGTVITNTVCASPDPLFPDGNTICDSVDITVADPLTALPLSFDALQGGDVTIDAVLYTSGGAQTDGNNNGVIDPFTYTTGTPPTDGTIFWYGSSFIYTNTSMTAGTDSFTIVVTDGGLNATGQVAGQQTTINVTINVIGVLAVANDFLTVDSGGQQTFDLPNLVTSGGKAPLQFSIQTNGGQGTASISGTTLTYQADPNSFGFDTVDVLIEDGMTPTAQSKTATLNVTITPPALTVTDGTLTVDSGASGDLDLSPLVTSAGITPDSFSIEGYPAQGTVSLNGSTLTYQADPYTFGSDTVTVRVSDSVTPTAQTAPITIDITIVPPALTVTDGTLTVDSGSSNSLDLATLVTSAGISPDTYDIETYGSKGTASLSGSTLSYLANANSFGTDTVTVRVTDSVTPVAQTAVVTIEVTISPPVLQASNGVLIVDSGASGSIDLSTLVTSAGISPLTYMIDTDGGKGSSTLNGATLTYTANDNTFGSDSVVIQLSDGVTPVAQTTTLALDVTIAPPELSVDSSVLTFDVVAGEPVTGNLAGAAFGGVAPYTFTLLAGPSQGVLNLEQDGTFTYTANPDAAGTDSFSFSVVDAAGTSTITSTAETTGTVSFTIEAVAPTVTASVTPSPTAASDVTPAATATTIMSTMVVSPTATQEIPPAQSTATAIATSAATGDTASGGITTLPSTGTPMTTGTSHSAILILLLAIVAMLLAASVGVAKLRRR